VAWGVGRRALHVAFLYPTPFLAIGAPGSRKAGVLAQSERAAGTAGAGRPKKGSHRTLLPKEDAPTLAALGLTKRESAEAQRLAALSRPVFEAVRDGERTRAEVKREAFGRSRGHGAVVCYTSFPDKFFLAEILQIAGHSFSQRLGLQYGWIGSAYPP
jgi:hypothetical protein